MRISSIHKLLREYETTILHFSSMEFFDDIFCYLSYFSGQKWPFSLSLRFLGPYLVHLQRFEITYPGKVSKIEKTKKSLHTIHPIKDFFHIATNVRVLCDNFFMFYKNFVFITKKERLVFHIYAWWLCWRHYFPKKHCNF